MATAAPRNTVHWLYRSKPNAIGSTVGVQENGTAKIIDLFVPRLLLFHSSMIASFRACFKLLPTHTHTHRQGYNQYVFMSSLPNIHRRHHHYNHYRPPVQQLGYGLGDRGIVVRLSAGVNWISLLSTLSRSIYLKPLWALPAFPVS